MGAALGWGALAAASLVIGAVLGLARRWPERIVGLVLAFGAGALISAVSSELAQEGIELGGAPAVMLGLATGALTYFGLDRILEPVHSSGRHRRGSVGDPVQGSDSRSVRSSTASRSNSCSGSVSLRVKDSASACS